MSSGICCCSRENEADESEQGVTRDHSWPKCVFMVFGLSLCITVDILQYSMPLAFLPSVLEDRGHAPSTIATAIGVYYWTGFLGCLLITGYQVCKLLKSEEDDLHPVTPAGRDAANQPTTVATVRRQIIYLIIGLGIGAATLIGQALHPRCWVHTTCRFIQGFAGSFIFIYAFLLSATLFKDKQQTFAMTMASTALNVAEVLGSSLGAYVFDRYGEEAVFAFMGVMSVLNQLLLIAVLAVIRGDGTVATPRPNYESAGSLESEGVARSPTANFIRAASPRMPKAIRRFKITEVGWRRTKEVFSGKRLLCAVTLIFCSAVVKGSVEEVLPFHADHRWHMEPLEIGRLFSLIALTYICASWSSGLLWQSLANKRVLFSAFWIVALGLVAYSMLLVNSYYHHEKALWVGVLAYGMCLGVTHTPATLILSDAVEKEEGRAKEVANGIFNTMWEAGGSLGFLLGGFLAHDYGNQLRLFFSYTLLCAACGAVLLYLGGVRDQHLKKSTRTPWNSYESTGEKAI